MHMFQMKKRRKLDDKGEKCIFLGVSDYSKAHKLYNPIIKKIIISHDVVFDEEKTWFWISNTDEQHVPADFESENEEETMQQAPAIPAPKNSQDEPSITSEI